jgi:transposase
MKTLSNLTSNNQEEPIQSIELSTPTVILVDGVEMVSKKDYDLLLSRVEKLEKLVALFTTKSNFTKNSKDSSLSSTPPSQDIGRSNTKSLREKSTLKSGGQSGHEGSTLAMSATPDEVIVHRPVVCKHCNNDLQDADFNLKSRKQEIYIPPIVPLYREHQVHSCVCNHCGVQVEGTMPSHLKGNIQYGSEIIGLIGYLSVRQYMPYARIAEFMQNLLGLPISEGTIDNAIKSLAKKAKPVYDAIQSKVEQSTVVGGDETGIKIKGKKGWLFVFQTTALTFLVASLTRGFSNISKYFENGFPMATYVSDSLAAQLKTPSKHKQLCLVHLIRELKNFVKAVDCKWSEELKDLLKEAIALKKELLPVEYGKNNKRIQELESKLDQLLNVNLTQKHEKIQAFAFRLIKYRDAVFTFLYHYKVPPHNNSSEQGVRNAKVKMKVSGQFNSLDGAQCFAILRSVVDTAIKNNQNPINAFFAIAEYMPAE